MIQLDSLTLAFGARKIFDAISTSIDPQNKIGLVGSNGAGKTTLLSVIAGQSKPDEGTISIPKGFRTAYMPQDVVLVSEKSVLAESLSIFPWSENLEQLTSVEQQLKQSPEDHELLGRYAELTHTLYDSDYELASAQAKKVLTGLGFSQQQLDQSVAKLSVGWKMRLVLAKLLLQQADFYLFDEPTNHLDLIAKDWFAEFLRNSASGFILVSHDKYFLDTVCSRICELCMGKLTCYTGNYDNFLQQKKAAQELQEKKYLEQQKYIKKQTETIERFKAKATKASMAQSMLKALEKIELIELDHTLKSVRISLAPTKPAGKTVLEIKNLSFSFGDKKIIDHAHLEIKRGHKVALVAPNGIGKTTLLNLIMGKLTPHAGTITFGHQVVPAFFEQDQNRSLNHQNNILQEVESTCQTPDQRARVRTLLGSFLFSGDDVNKKISVLSGGEKNRVAMVKILIQQANFLILDEPTNHLDIQSKDILLDALKQYDGTILFVSHDRTFLNSLATDIVELADYKLWGYSGNYDEYLYHKHHLNDTQKTKEPQKQAPKKSTKASHATQKKEQKGSPLKLLKTLETKIMKLEQEQKTVTEQFATLLYGTTAYQKATERLKKITQELQELYVQWESFID